MENYDPNLINQFILSTKSDEFSTSTPQRRLAKVSVAMKFDPVSSFTNWENSLSFLRTTETAVYDSDVLTMAVPRPSVELTSAEEALLQPTMVKRSGKKMSNNRRRRLSSVGANYKRPTNSKQQINKRREKRNDAFSECRKFIEEEHQRQSIKPIENNATFLIDGKPERESDVLDESYMERCEIDAFHHEVDRIQENGSTSLNNIDEDIPINENDENTNFEQLCATKASEHPYDETDLKMPMMESHEENNSGAHESVEELFGKSENEGNNNTMALSTNSSMNTTSTTAKANSHCTHTMYLHQHKIPQIVRHKSLARISFDIEENTSTQNQAIAAFKSLHPFIRYYLVGITVAFVGILMFVSPIN